MGCSRHMCKPYTVVHAYVCYPVARTFPHVQGLGAGRFRSGDHLGCHRSSSPFLRSSLTSPGLMRAIYVYIKDLAGPWTNERKGEEIYAVLWI